MKVPVVVVFKREDIAFLSDLIIQEKDRLVALRYEPQTVEQLDSMTGRLKQLVSTLQSINEGMVNAIEYQRELKNVEEN